MKECTPEYWFLGLNEKFAFTLRETNNLTLIPQQTLLCGRIQGWMDQCLNGDWQGLAIQGVSVLADSYTSNNLVTPLIDGKAYMADLYQELISLGANDFVLLAGWDFSMDQPLLADANTEKERLNSRLPVLLNNIRKKQGTIRLLAWDNNAVPTSWIPFAGNRQVVDFLNHGSLAGNRIAYASGNLDGSFLSHHQKEVVIGKPGWQNTCAYVGGIDLAVDRWDNGEHKKTEKEGHFFGWHDIQVKIQGDAVMQLWANFAERWSNDNTWLKKTEKQLRLLNCPQPTYSPTAPGTHHVQVLRTVAPVRSGFKERYMPHGERTVLCALYKAISRAECYIYIEEQFLWDCELADFIAARMKTNKALKLIVVLAAGTELPPWLGKEYSYHLRSEFFMKVMGVTRKEEIAFGWWTRVFAYGLFPLISVGQPVYVHSKLMIIDDRYVSVGSANFDARSMFIDTELTLGIVDGDLVASRLGGKDTQVCRFARDLREKLWKEHLRIKDNQAVDHDPIELLKQFPGDGDGHYLSWPTNKAEAKQRTKGHIRCYVNEPGSDGLFSPMKQLLDRNERHFG
jgi:phosphatidylserine/phosphatidylglycerophosphate/cardiolipin synthase-like enzyme